MAKTAFITGASGCIGRQLVEKLLSDDWEVTALLMPGEDDPFTKQPAVSSVVGDIRNFPAKMISTGAVIFHLAAKVHVVPKTSEDREDFFSVNHEGTAHVARNAVERQANGFVFTSTLAVYGDRIRHPKCDEMVVPEPITIYGKSKLKAEARLKEILAGNVPYVIVRPCAVYGPNDRGNFMSLVDWIVKKKRPYPLVGGGKIHKNVLSVSDLVGVFAYLGENMDRLSGKIFNVANPDYLTIREIVETIARAGNVDIKIMSIPGWLLKSFAVLGDMMGWVLRTEMPLSSRKLKVMTTDTLIDTRKLQLELKDQIRFTSFEDGMRELLEM